MDKRCAVCEKPFAAKRAAAKYCGETCRKRAQRRPKLRAVQAGEVVEIGAQAPDAGGDGALTAATRRELVEAGRLETARGQAALLAAIRLDEVSKSDTGAGVAALMKAHSEALERAVANAKRADSPLDKIRESAALKLIAGGV